MSLKETKKFRYFFQGIKGQSSSSGAILIDDIALTETVCPSAVWQISNFSSLLDKTSLGTPVRSKCFYNSDGYAFGISIYPNGRINDYPDYVGMTMHLCSGENDAVMEWPAKNRQTTIVAMDQDPDVKLRMSSTRSFTTGRSRLLLQLVVCNHALVHLKQSIFTLSPTLTSCFNHKYMELSINITTSITVTITAPSRLQMYLLH